MLPWYFADARVGTANYDNELSFNLYDLENNFILYLNAVNKTLTSDSGYLYQLEIPYTTGIINGNQYKVKYKILDEILYTSDNFIISWTRDSSNDSPLYNQSGDSTGYIDLTSTNNKIDEVKTAINQLESGEQQRESFWENVYNTMFVPSGDFIENKIQELKEELKISGEISGELLILNEIKNNSGDFVISWNTMSTHFSTKGVLNENQLILPSGEINFSKIERENETFQEVMKWVRILIGFSLIVILIKQGWTLLLKTLGLSTEVYEQHREEQERLNKAQEIERKKQAETTRRKIFNANQERLREYNKLARKRGWK